MIKIITTGAKSVLPFSPAIKAGEILYMFQGKHPLIEKMVQSLKGHLKKK